MHKGGYPRETDHPFPARWLVRATLRHRETDRTVVLLNTHLRKLARIFAETAADPLVTVW